MGDQGFEARNKATKRIDRPAEEGNYQAGNSLYHAH